MCAGDAVYPEVVSCEKRLCPVHPRRKRAVKSSFHYRKAVAPLKPPGRVPVLAVGAEFPLPKGGGPIEALCLAHWLAYTKPFPLPKGGGPIEAP